MEHLTTIDLILLGSILLAGFYMAWNIGANDVANALGTSVGSGALTLRKAVFIAAILEFLGAFFFGSHVSSTIQKGIIDLNIFLGNEKILVYGMFSSLIAAGVWLQIATYLGLPVSTTHSIVGSLVGFGAIVGGVQAIQWDTVAYIFSSWIISPLAGGILAFFTFSILRKMIFFNYFPLEQAKKLTPIIVFIYVTMLSLLLLNNLLENLDIEISTLQGVSYSLLLGLIGSLISIILIRRISFKTTRKMVSPSHSPEIANSLIKAKKHLQKVMNTAVGDMRYHTSILLEEVDDLSSSIKKSIEKEVSPSEYQYVEKIFSYLQIFSASLMAFAHGANDVANAIGPLAAAVQILISGTTNIQAHIPAWALILGGSGIIIGLATWGWRVIETIGKKITELTPTRGFAAEFGAATTILIASRLGMPISTTHTLVGAVIGVGFARGIEALNLAMIRDIIVTWIVTVPAGAFLAVLFFYCINFIFG